LGASISIIYHAKNNNPRAGTKAPRTLRGDFPIAPSPANCTGVVAAAVERASVSDPEPLAPPLAPPGMSTPELVGTGTYVETEMMTRVALPITVVDPEIPVATGTAATPVTRTCVVPEITVVKPLSWEAPATEAMMPAMLSVLVAGEPLAGCSVVGVEFVSSPCWTDGVACPGAAAFAVEDLTEPSGVFVG